MLKITTALNDLLTNRDDATVEDIARCVLLAIREPTMGMEIAGDEFRDSAYVWRAMIDHLLNEGNQ
jgi:hypothetical protein